MLNTFVVLISYIFQHSILNNFFSSQDLFGSSTSLRPSSIWDVPDAIPTPTSSGNLSARSLLNLALDLKPVSEVARGDPESPLDPFSIWASSTDPVSPYEGWNRDIKKIKAEQDLKKE